MEISTRLPYEVRDLIFSHLQVKDLISLSRVCHSFYNVMDEEFWRDVLHKRLEGPKIKRRRNQTAKKLTLKRLMHHCAHCESKHSVKHVVLHEKRLCRACRKLPKFLLISDYSARYKYSFTPKELEQLPCAYKTHKEYLYSRQEWKEKVYSDQAIQDLHRKKLAAAVAHAKVSDLEFIAAKNGILVSDLTKSAPEPEGHSI